MSKTLFPFFFLLFLAVAVVTAHITISPNVQFSFGCDPSLPLPQNCSGNYYFKTTLLNNDTPQYSFFDIKLYSNYSMWDNRMICRQTPFFQYVWTYPDIFNWECCNSNWQVNYTQCTIGDNHTLNYYDTNNCFFPNNLPPDNGTVSYCNYCSEDLYPTYGECFDNSTQTINWLDLNQPTCCDVTNLPTDCSIYTYPYNDTTYQACNSTSADIGTPNCRKVPLIGNRVREDCVVEIPTQYMNEGYKCFSLVKDKSSGQIVQVNPDQNRTYPVLESREYFTPLYNVVSFYYTAENLQPEKDYIVRMECSSPNRIIYSEYTINREYEDVSWVFYRIEWLKANASYIIGGVLVIIFISTIGFFILRLFK